MAGDAYLRKERLALQKIAPPPGTAASYSVHLSVRQLAEIERLAYQGMDLEQIRRSMRIPSPLWEAMKEGNPDLATAIFAGMDRMVEQSSRTVMNAIEGGDAQIAIKMLERFGGPQYRAPSQKVEISKPPEPIATIDVVESVQTAFSEQRRLLARSIEAGADQAGAEQGAEAGAVGAGAIDAGAVDAGAISAPD